jgi:hypothetical protein
MRSELFGRPDVVSGVPMVLVAHTVPKWQRVSQEYKDVWSDDGDKNLKLQFSDLGALSI